MARRPPETARFIRGRSPRKLKQYKFEASSEALPNFKLLKLNRVSELITSSGREFKEARFWTEVEQG